MSVVKVVELVGESEHTWTRAAENAVTEAARTIDNISGVEIANFTADVEDGQIVRFKANVKVAFVVDR